MLTVSDGAKKALIIGSTAAFPKPWRVAVRESWLARLELETARNANLIIIAHPKSGNTWLKVMLTRLYQVRHGLPDADFAKYSKLAVRHPAIPRFAATNACYSYEAAVGKALTANAPDSDLRQKPVVFIARNPCDIAVSWYFQFTKRQSAHKQELINHFIDHPIDRNAISIWDFVRHSDIGLPFLIDYLNTWEKNLVALERSLLIRYEDLRVDAASILRQITALMGDEFSDEESQAAVDFASFENLRKLETSGFFRQGGLTLRDPQDPESFKVRRGKINGYRDYFNAKQVADLEQLLTGRLSPALGYGAVRANHE